MTLQQRIAQLRKAQGDIGKVLEEAAEQATLRAIQVTAENTPANQLRGAETVSGALRASWAEDSISKPAVKAEGDGKTYTTYLRSNVQYASYVNDGHRMDRHFVPGLYVDETGTLAMNRDGFGGIVVGTQTAYVPGAYMTDKGKEEYEKALAKILDGKIREVLK